MRGSANSRPKNRYIKLYQNNQFQTNYSKPYFWTRAYFIATTGGAPLEVIKQYIQSQERPTK